MLGSKRQTGKGLVTIPVQGAWKLLQLSSGKAQYDRQRLARIAEGRRAVQLSTGAQRKRIIESFKEVISKTAFRQKLYRNAMEAGAGSKGTDSDVDITKNDSVDPASSSLSSVQTISVAAQDPNDTKHPTSSSTLVVPPDGVDDDEDAVFVHEMELATKLSQDEYERSKALVVRA
ncbi:hypothetical protein BDZ97DRAFT_422443 [Flammula alnicola]|nr:hypothetical protein BDZ97DRAFT_422443 [Flammula alnicola]